MAAGNDRLKRGAADLADALAAAEARRAASKLHGVQFIEAELALIRPEHWWRHCNPNPGHTPEEKRRLSSSLMEAHASYLLDEPWPVWLTRESGTNDEIEQARWLGETMPKPAWWHRERAAEERAQREREQRGPSAEWQAAMDKLSAKVAAMRREEIHVVPEPPSEGIPWWRSETQAAGE